MPVYCSIQWLRGLAAMAVLLFHMAQRSGQSFTVGAAGVDVFFVISGFIMWSVTDPHTVSPGQFFTRRLIRIVPLYWAVTLVMVAGSLVPGVFPALLTPLPHVLLSLLFIPHRDPTGDIYPVLVPGWTLTYEMAFYLLFAATLSLRRRLPVMIAVLAALVAVGAAFHPAGAVPRTYTDPIMLEFAAGMALAANPRMPRRFGWPVLAAGLAAFAIEAALPDTDAAWRVLLWGVPAVLVVAGSLALDGARPSWAGRTLMRLGDASYSIYLLHGLAVSACWRLLHAAPRPVFFAACLASSVLLGLACHAGFERPVTAALRRLGKRRGPVLV